MTQISFHEHFDGFPSSQAAKAARDEAYKTIKRMGYDVSRFVLKNQMMKYSGLGQPHGGIADSYYLDVEGIPSYIDLRGLIQKIKLKHGATRAR